MGMVHSLGAYHFISIYCIYNSKELLKPILLTYKRVLWMDLGCIYLICQYFIWISIISFVMLERFTNLSINYKIIYVQIKLNDKFHFN